VTDPAAKACPRCGAATADGETCFRCLLAAVRADPSYERLAADVPPLPALVGAMFLVPTVVGGCFTVTGVVGAGAVVAIAVGSGAPVIALVALFPLLFAGVGVGTIVATLRGRRKTLGEAVVAAPALVVATRTESGREATTCYVTLLLEDGAHRELGAPDVFHGAIAEGDVGVAHFRGRLLLGFRKLAG
jgi:hypothetical protein